MRKKHPEHVNLERWLVSYADFITLLFAFFVIMYAMSQADAAKFKSASASIRAAFSAAGPVGMLDLHGNAGGDTANPFEKLESPGGRILNLPAGKTHTATDQDPELQNMKELLEESISLELGVTDQTEQLQLLFDSQGLVLQIAMSDLFAPGEAAVRLDYRPVLDRVGRILLKTKRLIRIEGHTDPAEAKPQGFPSDWELSAARAAWVAKYWIERFGFDPKRMGAAGYSHYRPVKISQRESANTKDESEWAGARNRRIEIIILNNQYKE